MATEDNLRDLQAQIEALHFIIEILLADFINGHAPDDRTSLMAQIIDSDAQTAHLTGTASNEFDAEKIADLTVRRSGHLQLLLMRAAMRAAGKASGAALI